MTTLRSLPTPLARTYDLTPADFTLLAEVQNTVFAFSRKGAEYVLRLTPASHRSFEQVQAELDWLDHLSRQGLLLSVPVAAADGALCRPVEWEGRDWTAVAFTKAPGRIGAAQDWHADTFRAWGAMTGRLHLAAETYQAGPCRRQNWKHQLPGGTPASEDEYLAQEKLTALVAKIATLPGSPEHFGLIHSDLHFWNFAIDDRGPTAFDFDNCEYHWFLADVGTAVFESATCIHQRLPRPEFLTAFLREFLSGYRSARVPGRLLPHLPDFIKLREIQIFLILSRRWKDREIGPFQKAFFAATREAVLTDKPFIDDDTMAAVLESIRS